MEYGGRRHIELLTSTLNLLSYEAQHGDVRPDPQRLQDVSEALHAALVCHTRPVPLPPEYIALAAEAADGRDPSLALGN